MSSLEDELSDLQDFLLKQSQVGPSTRVAFRPFEPTTLTVDTVADPDLAPLDCDPSSMQDSVLRYTGR